MITRPRYVYVASSWRNDRQPEVCAALARAGIEHYDFKNPPNGSGFSWREVMPTQAMPSQICVICGREIVLELDPLRWVHVHSESLYCWPGSAAAPMDQSRATPPSGSRVPGKGTDWVPAETYHKMVNHPRATEGFFSDWAAMVRADTFIMVLPCGKSAHLELGWAVGAGKHTIILLEDPVEPELMYRMVDFMSADLTQVLDYIGLQPWERG